MQENYFHHHLYSSYNNFKEVSLANQWLKQSDILPLIEKLNGNNLFTIEKAGSSVENRDIYLISAGQGKTKILFWSQMHGDESTATMAIFDLFNFLKADDDFNSIRKKILSDSTLYFVPMLNPDGAEKRIPRDPGFHFHCGCLCRFNLQFRQVFIIKYSRKTET